MNKVKAMFFRKFGAGALATVVSCACFAKTPVDVTLNFLAGSRLGSSRSFNCREAVDGKVTDEHAYYEFHDDGDYSRLNSHPDLRTGHVNAASIKGKYRVKIENGMLKITFQDEIIGQSFLGNQKAYDAILIGTDNETTMALMMDRPVPGRADIRDHLRIVCVGDKPSGGGPQRSY